jgi:hypothetical protein
MTKRAIATVLWFIAGWYLGATIAFVFHFSPMLGPVIALSAAGLMGVDPRHVIWRDEAH